MGQGTTTSLIDAGGTNALPFASQAQRIYSGDVSCRLLLRITQKNVVESWSNGRRGLL